MGNPISHSKSPVIHQAFAAQFGLSISYQSILVEQGGFNEALEIFQQLGGKGLNITVPYKGDAWQSVNQYSKRAQQAEAVNTIWFGSDGIRHGDTTDGTGLIRDFINHGVSLKNKTILVIGAGGAVRGVLGDIHIPYAHVTPPEDPLSNAFNLSLFTRPYVSSSIMTEGDNAQLPRQ